MKELKEIISEDAKWDNRRFQLFKDICSSIVAKEGLNAIRGSHFSKILKVTDSIIENLYPGNDLITSEKLSRIEELFGNANGKLGSFNYETELRALFPKAAKIEIEEADWRESDLSQLDFLSSQLLDKSPYFEGSSHVFLLISSVDRNYTQEDLDDALKAVIQKPCTILFEKGGYMRKAYLLTITNSLPNKSK